MSHLVLARKYRPKTFGEVVGQDATVKTLCAAIEKDRMAHALLFTGSRGIGKTTIARLVAKALVCKNRSSFDPCNNCFFCNSIDDFSSLDVVEIDGASHTGVDDIRELRDSARFQPTSAPLKIFIIDEVHMLSISAFNALLKVLEEPPPHVMFIFATTEVHKIPQTILSRCQRYDFKRLKSEMIVETLKDILKAEKKEVDIDGLRLIADLADGALRDALSMTEQVLNCGEGVISQAMVASALGVANKDTIKEIAHCLLNKEISRPLSLVHEIYESGLDMCQTMNAFTECFRAFSLMAHIHDFNKVVEILPDAKEKDYTLANNIDKKDLKRCFAMALDAQDQVFNSKAPLYAIELFLLRMATRPDMKDATTINFCLNKLDAILHNRPLPKEPKEITISPKKKTSVVTHVTHNEANKKGQFIQFVENLMKTSPRLASHLRHARAIIQNNELVLNFEKSFHYEQLIKPLLNQALTKEVQGFFGSTTKLRFKLDKNVSEHTKVKTAAEIEDENIKREEKKLYEDARMHPTVKKILDTFGGDITEVKRIPTHKIPE